jgi:JmjC domain, hydroxylase
MLSPRILERSGVPVHQVVQEAGELVVTFPSAYHANLDLGTGVSTVVLPDASTQHFVTSGRWHA